MNRPSPSMRALRYGGPGQLALEDMPRPVPKVGDLLVEIAACGICATDVKTFMRGHPKIKPGSVLGHEMTGIAATDAGPIRKGNRVAIAPYAPCGKCRDCRRGQPLLCAFLFDRTPTPGGFSDFLNVPAELVADLVVNVPEKLSLVHATLAEPVACCINALERARVGDGDTVIILGDGPMGLIQAEAAKAMGAARVVITGMTPHRLAHARKFADDVVDVSAHPEVTVRLRQTLPQGADVVLVSIASPEAGTQAFDLVARGGVIDLFAGTPAGMRVSADAQLIHYEGVRLQGSFGFTPGQFRKAIDWLAAGRLVGADLVTGEVGMEGVPDALRNASRHEGIKTVMVRNTGG